MKKSLLPLLLIIFFFSNGSCGTGRKAQRLAFELPTKVFSWEEVDTKPTFRGGDYLKFVSWVLSNIKYPLMMLEDKIQGRVIINYIVDKEGNVIIQDVLQSPHIFLTQEVTHVLSKSPKWEPGTKDGLPVHVRQTIPLDFTLK